MKNAIAYLSSEKRPAKIAKTIPITEKSIPLELKDFKFLIVFSLLFNIILPSFLLFTKIITLHTALCNIRMYCDIKIFTNIFYTILDISLF